jgi:hypothetical protein
VLRGITIVVALACVVFALALPAVYFVLQRTHLESDLRVEAAMRARAVESLIYQKPDAWSSRSGELTALLEDRSLSSREFEVHLAGMTGESIAASSGVVPPPHVTQTSNPLRRAGEAVGFVRVDQESATAHADTCHGTAARTDLACARGKRSEIGVSRQYQPRNTHAHEWRHRHDRLVAQHPAEP